MFQSKKKKIAGYLAGKADLSAFDLLLKDYLERNLKQRLEEARRNQGGNPHRLAGGLSVY